MSPARSSRVSPRGSRSRLSRHQPPVGDALPCDALSQTGDEAGAAAAYAEVLTDSLRILGPDHTLTFRARFKIVYARDRLGDTAGATQELGQNCGRPGPRTGPRPPQCLRHPRDHCRAARRGRSGDAVGAAQAFAELLADCQRVLGPDHTQTRFIHLQYQYWRGQIGLWRRLQLRRALPPTR
ncbi:tetratricopeptide repeat protein [Streptomyces sp. BF23-30]|uniref:tetratricopeptide repeat protein n=1 Tax=Streptomyces sp. BF23-30 TaxID=3240281 RepID=UPI0034E4436D